MRESVQIYVNKSGYSAERRKLATVVGQRCETFELLDDATGEIMFSGTLSGAVYDQLSSNAVRIADFTSAPAGRHRLRVGGSLSPAFDIRVGYMAAN